MGFEFRLEKILDHRQFLLENARQSWQAARMREHQARERVRQMKERIQTVRDEWHEHQKAGMDVASFLAYRDQLARLVGQLPQLKQAQQAALAELERQRQRLLEREKAVKVLEKLRERCRQDYLLESARRDQKKLDETVILKNHREDRDA